MISIDLVEEDAGVVLVVLGQVHIALYGSQVSCSSGNSNIELQKLDLLQTSIIVLSRIAGPMATECTTYVHTVVRKSSDTSFHP